MTATIEGGEWLAARYGRTLHPGKTRYPFYRRLGGPNGRSGRAENLVPTGIRPRTVQTKFNIFLSFNKSSLMYFSAYKCGQFSNFAQRRNQEWKTDVVYETEGPSGTFTSFEIKLQGYYHRARYQSL